MKTNKLILQDKTTRLKVHNKYLEIQKSGESKIIAFMHIEEIYLYQELKVPIKICIQLAKKVPLYIIDRYGYIVAKIVSEGKNG